MRLFFYASCIVALASAFQPSRVQRRTSQRSTVGSLRAGIDVSGLSFVPISTDDLQAFSAVSEATSQTNSLSDIQNVLILVAGISYFAYEGRPRGSSRDDLLDVRRSKVPGANLGVYAKKFIPKETVVGYFPGYLRSIDKALDSSMH